MLAILMCVPGGRAAAGIYLPGWTQLEISNAGISEARRAAALRRSMTARALWVAGGA